VRVVVGFGVVKRLGCGMGVKMGLQAAGRIGVAVEETFKRCGWGVGPDRLILVG